MIYYLKNKYLEVAVNSDGGSMTSVKYHGEERQWQGDKFWKSQDVVIFPIVGHAGEYEVDGKIYAPKSHGVARYSEFALVNLTLDKLTLELTSNAVTRQTYPYDFVFDISYELKKNTVKITYTVRSESGEIPFYVGGHPGMKAPGGEAVIEFENEENPLMYPLGGGEAVQLKGMKRFVANKDFFKECKTFQLGNLSGGKIYAVTRDGYRYVYKSDCPVFAFWSNEEGGDYICVEPWWGINDYEGAPKELKDKPFINFAGVEGKSFSYTLTVEKS